MYCVNSNLAFSYSFRYEKYIGKDIDRFFFLISSFTIKLPRAPG